ncbi:MAG: puuB 1 [Bacteroidota bacterium]|nr:puuB 1 [Bacteroidota bacterium]
MKNTSNTRDGKVTAGRHTSFWIDSVKPSAYPQLTENIEADVVIVGGGLGGVSVAYCLSQSGKKVVLVEDGLLGSGETGRTTAHLTTSLDERYYELEKIFGGEEAKLIAQSHMSAIDFIEETAKKEGIECEFERVNGYLFVHPSETPDILWEEFKAASRVGIEVTQLDNIPGVLTPGKCLQFLRQAKFHPMKYLSGLANAAVKNGVKIFTETHAEKIDHKGITTDKGFSVKAKHIVIATNSPVNNKVVMHLKQNGYRSYVIGALVKKGTLPNALWWDTGDVIKDSAYAPYHYVRLTPYDDQYDLLISGGEDHVTGDTTSGGVSEKKRYANLENWTRRHFPIEQIIYHWSGEVMETIDYIAFIGRNPWDKDNVYIITGDSGDGMTYCTIGGMLIADLINGKENKWEKIYDPSRVTLKKMGNFFKGLMQGVIPGVKKSTGDEHELLSIKMGEGKLMDLHGEKCGVYRDSQDRMHIVSAKCTHLGCSVAWNNDEKSWDCPCHGSRFTYEGKVIHGPANTDLPSYTLSGFKETVHAK